MCKINLYWLIFGIDHHLMCRIGESYSSDYHSAYYNGYATLTKVDKDRWCSSSDQFWKEIHG